MCVTGGPVEGCRHLSRLSGVPLWKRRVKMKRAVKVMANTIVLPFAIASVDLVLGDGFCFVLAEVYRAVSPECGFHVTRLDIPM
jgi:hypothetical protein